MSNINNLPSIPDSLTRHQKLIYEKIIRTVNDRPKSVETPHVVVITDLGKDYDDLTAMLVLKELHRLGAIKLEGFIANLTPEKKRAHLARKALDSLRLEHIPVGLGTRGTEKEHEVAGWEFPKEIMGEEPYPPQKDGQKLLLELVENAEKGHYKLTFLLISSLRDIHMFEKRLRPQDNSPHRLKSITSKVILQGSYFLQHGFLEADRAAANNDEDWAAAEGFHHFLSEQNIPSVVYTKNAAFDTPLNTNIFKQLADTGEIVGKALYDVQRPQNLDYYRGACQNPPKYPGRTQKWFLENRSTFYNTHPKSTPDEALPKSEGEDILKYCRVIVYDALAALGTSGDDILATLNVLQDPNYSAEVKHSKDHRIVGISKAPNNISSSRASTKEKDMRETIEALMLGALLDCKSKKVQE